MLKHFYSTRWSFVDAAFFIIKCQKLHKWNFYSSLIHSSISLVFSCPAFHHILTFSGEVWCHKCSELQEKSVSRLCGETLVEKSSRGGFCEEMPEASLSSGRASASWVQDRPTAGQSESISDGGCAFVIKELNRGRRREKKCSRCQGKVLCCAGSSGVQGDYKVPLNHREHEEISSKEDCMESAPHVVGLHCNQSVRLCG